MILSITVDNFPLDELNKLCDACDTLCNFCEADECKKCIVTRLIDDAYNEVGEESD